MVGEAVGSGDGRFKLHLSGVLSQRNAPPMCSMDGFADGATIIAYARAGHFSFRQERLLDARWM